MMAQILNRWFPARPNRDEWAPRLAAFYARNEAYHQMTRSGDKTGHPQVQLLLCLIARGEVYAEIGCGGGVVSQEVGRTAQVVGFDISPIAIRHAGEVCRGLPVRLACASADAIPLAPASVSGVWCFEVLEHLWDPVAALREMVRIVRPGGFILLSVPLRFSLDLHLRKHRMARMADFAAAVVRRGMDCLMRAPFVNVCPDLDAVYPDCDMIAAINPERFAATVESLGCDVLFWDTTYMCSQRTGATTSLGFQRNTARPFLKHFGDHCLLLARKAP